jgi:taurine dioxygenase
MSASFDVKELTPTIGAIICGAKLSSALDEHAITVIRSLLLKHKVIFFEDQDLTPLAQRDFARRFGELHVHPVYPTHPEVGELVVLDNGPNNPTDNDSWHSDATFLPNPIMATMLYARVLPPCGGDTLWSDMRAAYLSLSEPFRRMLCGLTAVHDFQSAFPPKL